MKWNRPSSTRDILRLTVLILSAQAWDVTSTFAAGPKGVVAQKNAVRAANAAAKNREKAKKAGVNKLEDGPALVSKFSRKSGDKDTWYVIIAADFASGGRLSEDSRSMTLELQAAGRYDATLVKGRHDAAIAVYDFLSARNTAAAALGSRVGGVTVKSDVNLEKGWRGIAFEDEAAARALLDRIKPSNPD